MASNEAGTLTKYIFDMCPSQTQWFITWKAAAQRLHLAGSTYWTVVLFKANSHLKGRKEAHFCFKVVLSPGLSTHSNVWQLQPSEALNGPAVSSAVSDGQARQPHYASILLLMPQTGTNLFAYLCMDIMPFSWVNVELNSFGMLMNATSKQNWTILLFFSLCIKSTFDNKFSLYCNDSMGWFQVCFLFTCSFSCLTRGQCSVEGLSHV